MSNLIDEKDKPYAPFTLLMLIAWQFACFFACYGFELNGFRPINFWKPEVWICWIVGQYVLFVIAYPLREFRVLIAKKRDIYYVLNEKYYSAEHFLIKLGWEQCAFYKSWRKEGILDSHPLEDALEMEFEKEGALCALYPTYYPDALESILKRFPSLERVWLFLSP